MKHTKQSRRRVLKQLASMTAIGAMGSLRSLSLYAGERGSFSTKSIPGVEGKVIRREDADYEAWRQSMIWHNPSQIAILT